MNLEEVPYDDADHAVPAVPTTADGIILVGTVGDPAAQIVIDRTRVADVHTRPSVRGHWRSKHGGQYDPAVAESMLPDVLRDPLRVLQGEKASTLVFLGHYSDTKYLVLPVKCLKGELWIGTMFVANKGRFDKKRWVKVGVLYERD